MKWMDCWCYWSYLQGDVPRLDQFYLFFIPTIKMKIKFKKFTDNAICPKKQRDWDACFDLYSAEDCTIAPGKTAIILTWIGHELPQGFFWKIYWRSWLSKSGIISIGGVIDENYRGIIGVGLLNTSDTPYEVKEWDRIAQYAIHKVEDCEREEVDYLSETNRGENGFGSSGK